MVTRIKKKHSFYTYRLEARGPILLSQSYLSVLEYQLLLSTLSVGNLKKSRKERRVSFLLVRVQDCRLSPKAVFHFLILGWVPQFFGGLILGLSVCHFLLKRSSIFSFFGGQPNSLVGCEDPNSLLLHFLLPINSLLTHFCCPYGVEGGSPRQLDCSYLSMFYSLPLSVCAFVALCLESFPLQDFFLIF